MSDKNNTKEYVLYILMRTDLPSMNAGKGMAQASHASNAFVKKFGNTKEAKEWQNETKQGFGTVLVLGVNGEELMDVYRKSGDDQIDGIDCDIIDDPTYPFIIPNVELFKLMDGNIFSSAPIFKASGEVVCFRQEQTCGYVFGDKNDKNLRELVKSFKLHP